VTGANAGRISLGAAITGSVLAVLTIGVGIVSREAVDSTAYYLGIVLVILFESLAAAFGVAGRRTDAGLAGLTLGCAVLLLLFCLASAVVKSYGR